MLDPDGDGVRTGGDLRFFASSGRELAYEIADWNTSGTSTSGKSTFLSGTNTVILLPGARQAQIRLPTTQVTTLCGQMVVKGSGIWIILTLT